MPFSLGRRLGSTSWVLLLTIGCGSVEPAPPGTSWTRLASPTTADLALVYFLNERQGWVVGTEGTVLGTVDGGRSWQLLSEKQLADGKSFFRCEHVVFEDERRGRIGVCCGMCDTGGNWLMSVWETVDGGRTWAEGKRAEAEKSGLTKEPAFVTTAGETWMLSHQGSVIVGKGTQWTSTTNLMPGGESWYSDVWFSSPRTGCLIGRGESLFRTDDGGAHWVRKGAGQLQGPLRRVRMASDASITVSGGSKIYGSADGGETWVDEWSGGKEDEILGLRFLTSKVGLAVGKGGLILRRSR